MRVSLLTSIIQEIIVCPLVRVGQPSEVLDDAPMGLAEIHWRRECRRDWTTRSIIRLSKNAKRDYAKEPPKASVSQCPSEIPTVTERSMSRRVLPNLSPLIAFLHDSRISALARDIKFNFIFLYINQKLKYCQELKCQVRNNRCATIILICSLKIHERI